uniref:NADH dehydrogenase subunit 1 n=1 Tax=Parasaissetia nigra TaxID=1069709 RepID=UPI0021FFE146|nr:NADH dehydrogenase subunit 1 [Parasaissetia nigra]UXW93672.1 NADH dehydrogenase subunit 1 [Parasaissetia nigra]
MVYKFFLLMINFMLSVGFFMYIERKLLGLSHYREGPNKVFIKGYFQFIFDMIKLLSKSFFELYDKMVFTYFFIPMLMFINIFLLWLIFPYNSDLLNKNISMIYLIVLLVMKMFFFVVMIFFIYSSYSYLSMIRMVIQIISYDIIIILIFLFNFIIYSDFDFELYKFNLNYFFLFFMSLVIFIFWYMSIIVELIRLPFDFYEGESELVSGFNIEYGSFLFLILVLVEYLEMIYFMIITVYLFIWFDFLGYVFIFFLFMMIFFLIWLRLFFVRYRLDKMLYILWKFIFPFTMIFIFIYYYLNLI